MPVNLYQSYTNPITGETFECTGFTDDCYRMNWTVAPKGYVALEHIHYFQEEVFHVKQGLLKIKIADTLHLVKPGETIVVPRQASHLAENGSDDTLICVVEYKPGLDYCTFFQCFIGLQLDKNYDKRGQINIPKMAFFMNKTKCNALARPASIPRPMFAFVLKFFGLIGPILGWNKQLERYVGTINQTAANPA